MLTIDCTSVNVAAQVGGFNSSLYQQWRTAQGPRSGNIEAVESIISVGSRREEIEIEFNYLSNRWKLGRNSSSSVTEISMNPAYQQIIGLGKPAIGLILRELGREIDHWFWALKAITREDPVPPESRGRMREMARLWLDWGRKNGYVR
jgi:hypothetical protein